MYPPRWTPKASRPWMLYRKGTAILSCVRLYPWVTAGSNAQKAVSICVNATLYCVRRIWHLLFFFESMLAVNKRLTRARKHTQTYPHTHRSVSASCDNSECAASERGLGEPTLHCSQKHCTTGCQRCTSCCMGFLIPPGGYFFAARCQGKEGKGVHRKVEFTKTHRICVHMFPRSVPTQSRFQLSRFQLSRARFSAWSSVPLRIRTWR